MPDVQPYRVSQNPGKADVSITSMNARMELQSWMIFQGFIVFPFKSCKRWGGCSNHLLCGTFCKRVLHSSFNKSCLTMFNVRESLLMRKMKIPMRTGEQHLQVLCWHFQKLPKKYKITNTSLGRKTKWNRHCLKFWINTDQKYITG